jgi:hypothetical protein
MEALCAKNEVEGLAGEVEVVGDVGLEERRMFREQSTVTTEEDQRTGNST